jgi:hypothetical protein
VPPGFPPLLLLLGVPGRPGFCLLLGVPLCCCAGEAAVLEELPLPLLLLPDGLGAAVVGGGLQMVSTSCWQLCTTGPGPAEGGPYSSSCCPRAGLPRASSTAWLAAAAPLGSLPAGRTRAGTRRCPRQPPACTPAAAAAAAGVGGGFAAAASVGLAGVGPPVLLLLHAGLLLLSVARVGRR